MFSVIIQPISFKSTPNVLVFQINSRNIKISKTLKYEQEGETVVLDVRGLMYHGDFHFTSHIIGIDGNVWYHDGMITGALYTEPRVRLESLGVHLHSRRTPSGVQVESRRSPNGVQEDLPGVLKESRRSPGGLTWSPQGVQQELTRSPSGVDKDFGRRQHGL